MAKETEYEEAIGDRVLPKCPTDKWGNCRFRTAFGNCMNRNIDPEDCYDNPVDRGERII